jgi:magnesium chelatase family protein
MSSKVMTAAVLGLNCELVEVEADTTPMLPKFFIVGLPDKSVDESKERVRSAIKNSGFKMPRAKITINLAPADLRKEGPAYDLPIAVSILLTTKQLFLAESIAKPEKQIFIGELALNGRLRPVNGVLSVCLAAKEQGIKNIYLPHRNAAEATLIKGLNIYPCKNLSQLVKHLSGKDLIKPFVIKKETLLEKSTLMSIYDMAYVKGQHHVKRALEIAAAGSHNVLLSGPPGAGKTLLAKTMASILPAMTTAESLEVTRVYSVAGILPNNKPLITDRPFRSPHHTASGVALVGGGAWPKPGEISLSHRGILFLDEFPEFPRVVLENLRQPIEDGVISVSRASGTLSFPAKFVLVAAMNPCPCGYLSDADRNCSCLPAQVINYQKKISGPLIDRIDLHVEVPKVKFEKLADDNTAEPSDSIRQRVESARTVQKNRFVDCEIITNAEMSSRQTKQFCAIDQKTVELLKQAVNQLGLSARSYFRILKLARTIADLSAEESIKLEHVAEALQYRPKVE